MRICFVDLKEMPKIIKQQHKDEKYVNICRIHAFWFGFHSSIVGLERTGHD